MKTKESGKELVAARLAKILVELRELTDTEDGVANALVFKNTGAVEFRTAVTVERSIKAAYESLYGAHFLIS